MHAHLKQADFFHVINRSLSNMDFEEIQWKIVMEFGKYGGSQFYKGTVYRPIKCIDIVCINSVTTCA